MICCAEGECACCAKAENPHAIAARHATDVAANAMVRDLKELGDVPIKPGQSLYLRDMATISDDADTSTGYATYYNVYGALKCSQCRLEWKSFGPAR